MTETETPTYPYGETPEDVIREQIREVAINTTFIAGPCWPTQVCRENPDDLLTVLDALKVASKVSSYECDPGNAHDVRISILAALGIEEG